MAKSFLGNIRAHKSPKWLPGGNVDNPWNYQLTFNLFNGSLDAAVNNYIFVTTIAPNNMWLQYGLL